LKDIEREVYRRLEAKESFNAFQMMKKEAIKWVKTIESDSEIYGTNIFGLNKAQMEITRARAVNIFELFFNITEEDLK